MKDFKEFLTEARDPPMLLTLRRQGIRNFPNGERVALFSNPQLNISLAIPYDFNTGTLKPSNVKSIKENDEFKDKDDRLEELQSAYDTLTNKKELTELERALFNWLSSEIDEYGDFGEMDDEILDDVYNDYKALTEAHIVERKANKRHRKFSSFADWHDHATNRNRNTAKFRVHNNGDLTSAFFNGKRIGSYNHRRKYGDLFESVIHHLNRIVNTGEEEEVKFSNGDTLRVHPVTAQLVVNLYNKVNDGNQRKISQMIHAGSAGLVKVADFAKEQLKRDNN
jgi:hypothetical protein